MVAKIVEENSASEWFLQSSTCIWYQSVNVGLNSRIQETYYASRSMQFKIRTCRGNVHIHVNIAISTWFLTNARLQWAHAYCIYMFHVHVSKSHGRLFDWIPWEIPDTFEYNPGSKCHWNWNTTCKVYYYFCVVVLFMHRTLLIVRKVRTYLCLCYPTSRNK